MINFVILGAAFTSLAFGKVICGNGHTADICAVCPHLVGGGTDEWHQTPSKWSWACGGECQWEGKECVDKPNTPWSNGGTLVKLKSHFWCLDAAQHEKGGVVTMQWCDETNWNQRWEYTGEHQLKLLGSDWCLDGTHSDGGLVHLWPCGYNNWNQKWGFDATTGQIKLGISSNYCLDMNNDVEGSVEMWSCNDNDGAAAHRVFEMVERFVPLDETHVRRSCCRYQSKYGVWAHSTWGSTPSDEQQWYKDHNCDDVLSDADTILANCGLILQPEDQRDCRCTGENTGIFGVYTGDEAYVSSYCNNWNDWNDDGDRWCFMSGGASKKSCPGAHISAFGDYWTNNDAICSNAWTARNGFPQCTGPNFERTSDTCCEGLNEVVEARPLADPHYCTENNPGHGKTCWSTIVMCRPDYCGIETNAWYQGKDMVLGGSGGAYKGHLRDADTCRQACIQTPGCKAWTYEKYKLSGEDNCWLKDEVSLSDRELDDCCDSGMLCKVKSFDCTDLKMPTADEIIDEYCSPGLIDVLRSKTQSTGATPVEMSLTESTSDTDTRSTQTAFTQEHGWNLEQMDSSMHETSSTTSVTTKDPETSQGFSFGIDGASMGRDRSTSCLNQNTERCTAKHWGLLSIFSFFGGSHNDDEKCKCKEVTQSKTDTFSETHTTTMGQMESQSKSQTNGFEYSKETYEAETATWQCPEYNDCVYMQYTMTTICAIPYWGTCTTTFEEKDPLGKNILKQVDIKRDDKKNQFLITKSSKSTATYVRSTGKQTDGKTCGVQLTPAVDNSSGPKFRDWLACPDPKEVHYLPNCDCMLPRFKDCQTPTHSSNVLTQGDKCQLANRPTVAGYDYKGACLESEPTWIEVGNCFGVDVYYVSGYNTEVYIELYKGIRGSNAKPESKVTYDFDMVREYEWMASHDTSDGYVHDGSVLLDGKDSTYWNVLGMPSNTNFWYVVFDLNSQDTVVSQFKIKNYGDVTHDAKQVLLQCSNDEGSIVAANAVTELPGAQFTLKTGTSEWQTFVNTNKTACRYWKVSVLNLLHAPWLRQVEFITQNNNNGRRLQATEDHAEEGHMLAPL